MTGSERVPQSTSKGEGHRTVGTVYTVEKKAVLAFKLCTLNVLVREGAPRQLHAEMLPLLDSILIPYHRDHRGLRAMISLSF